MKCTLALEHNLAALECILDLDDRLVLVHRLVLVDGKLVSEVDKLALVGGRPELEAGMLALELVVSMLELVPDKLVLEFDNWA